MDIGMLWYDDTKRPLDDKIARAAEHYKTKYGLTPTVCFVHPSLLPQHAAKNGATELAAGVQLLPARNVLVNHFWIGVDEAATRPSGAQPENGNGLNGKRRKREGVKREK
jgi:hypothetical protein